MATTPKALPALASEINAEHEAAEKAINDALLHARNAGRLLIEAKAQVKHGEWGVWVTENFHGSYRTAAAYMRVARHWSEIEANVQTSADLSIDAALKLIAEPREEEPVDTPIPASPPEPDPTPAAPLDSLRLQREASAPETAAWPESYDDHDDTPEPERPATPAPERSTLVPPRRLYTARMKALISAAQDAADASDEEIAGVPTNDLMIAGLKRARDLLDRIIEHHTSKGRNHVSA